MQHSNTAGCILLKFYIKPQHTANVYNLLYVVSYRNSTSNHNMSHWRATSQGVVSYRNSTSNHNLALSVITGSLVVSYRNSTSNHNVRFNFPAAYEVVSYRNSTSNHNTGGLASGISGLYLIEILHQTTTMSRSTSKATTLYLIEILHQTTTLVTLVLPLLGCILSKFYIKPQPPLLNSRRPPRCILSKFYIKPQQCPDCLISFEVVSYRNSTSNHNDLRSNRNVLTVVSYRNSTSNHNLLRLPMLNGAVVSYRNSTSNHNSVNGPLGQQGLYLIEILHQTTTAQAILFPPRCCILSKFYIKPQRRHDYSQFRSVVSYRNSTSNHNEKVSRLVVADVVSYRNSTSNHNFLHCVACILVLYLIEILHQTTTRVVLSRSTIVLYLIEILHQTTTPLSCKGNDYGVVSYRNSTSNHNFVGSVRIFVVLYLIEILHQTTTVHLIKVRRSQLYLIEILHQTTTRASV